MKHNFERFCKDYKNIENYQKAKADNFKGWNCHHRLETHNSDGERRIVDISVEELEALGMYYNRPASELIFLTVGEHTSLHDEGENHPFYGKHHSEETRKKIGIASKGNKNMLGKHHSEEAKNKISKATKGENNPMYGKKHSAETRKKMSAAKKGKHWYNNGKINIRAKDCPPGFAPGRLLKGY